MLYYVIYLLHIIPLYLSCQTKQSLLLSMFIILLTVIYVTQSDHKTFLNVYYIASIYLTILHSLKYQLTDIIVIIYC